MTDGFVRASRLYDVETGERLQVNWSEVRAIEGGRQRANRSLSPENGR